MDTIQEIRQAVEDLEDEKAVALVKRALQEDLDPQKILSEGVEAGVRAVGDKFQSGEYFIAELMMGGDLAQACVSLLEPAMADALGPTATRKKGKVVIGTVHGDIHSIGKDLVTLLLRVGGFDVYDIGINLPTLSFIDKAEEVKADIIALSSLMVVTMPKQAEVIKYLTEMGLRDKYKVIVGGGPTTQDWAKQIGADGWARSAAEAVALSEGLVTRRHPA